MLSFARMNIMNDNTYDVCKCIEEFSKMFIYISSRRTKDVIKLFFIISLIFIILCALSKSISKPNKEKMTIVWWTPFITGRDRIIECNSGSSCLVSNNKSLLYTSNVSASIFYGSSFTIESLPLPKRIPWAIYHEESPKNLALFMYKQAQDIFHYTATISRYSDLPVTLQYLKNMDVLLTNRFYKSIPEKNLKLNTLAPVLYLQSDCDTPMNRNAYVEQLSQFISVDSYGACLNNRSLPDNLHFFNNIIDYYNDKLMHFISQYKFVISIENAQCYDYISEKFWRSLIVGSIPIYKGAPNIKDWFPNNLSAILVDDFANAKQLATFLHSINNNDSLYENYLSHKIHKTMDNSFLENFLNLGNYGITANYNDDHPVFAFECLICDNLHRKLVRRPSDKNVFECLQPINIMWQSHWTQGEYGAEELKQLILT